MFCVALVAIHVYVKELPSAAKKGYSKPISLMTLSLLNEGCYLCKDTTNHEYTTSSKQFLTSYSLLINSVLVSTCLNILNLFTYYMWALPVMLFMLSLVVYNINMNSTVIIRQCSGSTLDERTGLSLSGSKQRKALANMFGFYHTLRWHSIQKELFL